MQYDIALKCLLEFSRESFFRDLLHEDVLRVEAIEELPQETVSIKRTDYPVRVRMQSGEEIIHLVEFLSDWEEEKLLAMIQYRTRYQEKFRLPVRSTLVLFRPHKKAVDYYCDSELEFRFHLIKLWEYPAYEFLDNNPLLPLVPLMQGGLHLAKAVEDRIYASNSEFRVDMLTIFGILLGLRDKRLSKTFFERRRDIMVTSPMYEWILEEGIEKGIEKGKMVGLEEGKAQGREEGKAIGLAEGAYQQAVATARAMLLEGDGLDKIARVTGLSFEAIEKL